MSRDLRQRAWKRVRAIKRFYVHAGLTGIIGVFFLCMNIITDPFDMWFFYPMVPLGSILAVHYLLVFGIPGSSLLSREWEEDEFEKQLERLEHIEGLEDRKRLPYRELSEDEALILREIQKDHRKTHGKDYV